LERHANRGWECGGCPTEEADEDESD
jgi:hypothetical protein